MHNDSSCCITSTRSHHFFSNKSVFGLIASTRTVFSPSFKSVVIYDLNFLHWASHALVYCPYTAMPWQSAKEYQPCFLQYYLLWSQHSGWLINCVTYWWYHWLGRLTILWCWLCCASQCYSVCSSVNQCTVLCPSDKHTKHLPSILVSLRTCMFCTEAK